MTSSNPVNCPHELRPGTKVCLHCRRAEREVKAARQRAVLTRLGLTAAAIAGCAYAGLAGYRAWKGQGSPTISALLGTPAPLEAAPVRTLLVSDPATSPGAAPTAQTAELVTDSLSIAPGTSVAGAADSTVAGGPAIAVPAAATSSAVPSESLAAPVVVPPPAPVTTPPAPVVAPPLQPVVAEGRTELQNGIYALRRGDTVTVHFDTPEARTRRPEKFEQIVRATLPAVHGAAAQSILSGIAAGNLVAPGATITEPAAIALRGGDGKVLSVVPQTRPGRDGPLVVAYRVTPAR